jgi:hypothetical protein
MHGNHQVDCIILSLGKLIPIIFALIIIATIFADGVIYMTKK